MRAIQAPESIIIIEQLIIAGINSALYNNKDILFEAMKADAQFHSNQQKTQQYIPNEKTAVKAEKTIFLLQKGFSIDQSHLVYAAKNLRDVNMVALLLKQPSITVKMINDCLEVIKKISLQNKQFACLSMIIAPNNFSPIIEELERGLYEHRQQQSITRGGNRL